MKTDYLIKFKKKIEQNLQQVWRAVLKSLQARPKTYLLVLSSLVLIIALIPILNSIKKSQTSQAAGLQIQSVFPRIGTPAGGDKVRIRGRNFQSPTQLTQVAAGWAHTCALGSDAKAYCWGYGDHGRLGNNTTTDAHTPVAVHQGQIPAGVSLTQIATSSSHTCALGSDAKAYCWGGSSFGGLGNNTTTDAHTPVAVHQGQIPAGVSLTQITVGYHTCAIGSDAKAYCWGYNYDGQLGNNTTTDAHTPVAVHQGQIPTGVSLTQINAGSAHICALGSDAKAYCWGRGSDGRLGNNTTANASTPVAVHQGQIPAGSTQVKVDNTPVPVKYISPYELEITMPAHSAGKVNITVINPDNTTHTLSQAYEYYTQSGLVIWSIAPRSGPVAGNNRLTASGANLDPMRWKGVYSGVSHTCALSSQSKVYCWGKNDHGQLGTGNTTDSSIPVATKLGEIPPTVTILQLAVKANHACVLASNGRAYCWGKNDHGQIGNSSTTNALTPVAIHQGQIPSGVSLTQITVGFGHSCALGSNSKVYCWGWNAHGQLATDNTTDANTPVSAVQGEIPNGVSPSQIFTGGYHNCIIGSNAKTYCWGKGDNGQLGNNWGGNMWHPVALHQGEIPTGITLTQIDPGEYHTCALGSDNKAYCWGHNADGQLGNNTTTVARVPVAVHQGQIISGATLARLASGSRHTCAFDTNNKAYCWGYNSDGQLGTNSTASTSTPVAVHQGEISNGVGVTQISIGESHTCSLGSNHKMYCWGSGGNSRLGNDATTNVPTPIRVHDNVYNIKAGQADETTSPGLKRVMASSNYELSFNVPPASLTNSNKPAPHVGRIGFVFTHTITGNYLSGIEYTYYTTPPAPTNLTTTTTLPLGSITLSFKSPSTAGLDSQANAGNNYSAITDYRIDYCLANSAGTACQDPTNTTPTTTNPTNWLTHTHTPLVSTSTSPLSLTIPNLTKPGKYLFRVAAINQAGLGTYAQSIATLASYVSLQTSPTLGINLTPLHNQTYSSNKLTLISSSNLTAGHKLTMTSTTTNNQLTHTTIPANTISSTTHSFTSPNTLTPNTWGFYIPNTTTNQQHNTISYTQFSNQDTTYTNQSNPNLKHAQIPTTPLTIANYNQPLTNQPLNLIFGINISNTQPSGNYQATMKFEVVGN